MNDTSAIPTTSVTAVPLPMSSCIIRVLVTISFLIGIVGNSIALVILKRSAKRRNKKHVLMLRWLAVNDLTAAIGMLLTTNLRRYQVLPEYGTCTALVLIRGFGLGSGIVALIMALERWFALTRPFLYHKLVTYDVLKRTLCCLWLSALLLTYSPLFGFGQYYNFENQTCTRYRFATVPKHQIYAWLNFAVGCLVCFCIALCNIAVVLELSKIRSQNRVVVRRISRSLMVNNRTGCPRHHQTPEEVAFAKLMAYISVIFCLCWLPQMITIPLAQFSINTKGADIFMKVADMMMAFYFTLDPFVYVLQRYIEKGTLGLPWCFLSRRKSTSSLPTTTTTGGGDSVKWSTQDTSGYFLES
ncbi:prostacyclin receptor isoform X2 [Anthonomus grandis grandis]|uniref:prostacyclin receptor isoform X2 n=1 Tax=Anthonomus grandis grandis TaxID=2921223 RepID=UPI0021669C82|nr:prostacyclin receptor isoform X2 [Anthonomus grandis grandis]